jgi:hypothetical protein
MLGMLSLLVGRPAAGAESLEREFAVPPDSAKPWAYWWWLDSYATTAGITCDLEEMKRQGIAGVLLFDAGEGGPDAPDGPVFMSEAWRALFKHAVREADRLGIAMGVNLCSGWDAGGTWVDAENAAKQLVWSSAQVKGPSALEVALPAPAAQGGYYRDIAVLAVPAVPDEPTTPPVLKYWEHKAARRFLGNVTPGMLHEEAPPAPNESFATADAVIDLTKHMNASGRLVWTAPTFVVPASAGVFESPTEVGTTNSLPTFVVPASAGVFESPTKVGTTSSLRWTVLRLGYTLLGAKTKCTSPGAQGYEIDFLSTRAMDLHFAETAGKLIADAGPLAGKTLQYVHDDSFEVCGPDGLQMTWTPTFIAEFRARRGYDPSPYLPVLTGRILDSRELSSRFLWDYRRTIGDLYATNHYRRMSDLAKRHGLGTHPESGGPFWPHIDALLCEGINDIPMGEFWKRAPEPDGKVAWADAYPICDTVKQAASAAHIYGKPICQAEAFTSMGPNWEEDFFDLKDIADKAFCAGLTRNVLCFYVHQPRLDIKPGYQWEAAGTHFDRNVTWWPQIHAFLTYLSRCQYMLRQGRFVADFCYYYGEDVPNYVPAKTYMNPPLPKGFDCDTINADVLLNRMSVKDGRLVLPDGMSYRYLVLPHREDFSMSPAVMRKIKELVENGATVIGPRPQRAPGLTDYPGCDAEVERLANALWGPAQPDGKSYGGREFGKGRIFWGGTLSETALAYEIAAVLNGTESAAPDFEFRGARKDANLDFIHRSGAGAEIYFVSNQMNRPERAECVFRVAGRQPEFWDAVTGRRWDATDWREENGRTVVPMEFAPRQSWFIVFRRAALPPSDPAPNFPALEVARELSGPWTVRFDPAWGGPEEIQFDSLVDWTKRPEEGIRYYSGKATYIKMFDLPESIQAGPRGTTQPLYLDIGRVRNVAQVRLNAQDLGVIWTAPWRVEIGAAVRPKGNRLEIDVVNLWPNRLIGDAKLPPEKRRTVTNVKKFKADSPLLESGLLGPVTLLAE